MNRKEIRSESLAVKSHIKALLAFRHANRFVLYGYIWSLESCSSQISSNARTSIYSGKKKIATISNSQPVPAPESDYNAAAIVSAINNTYGKNINPETVVSMLDVLQLIVKGNECEKEWISESCISYAKAAIEKSKL